MTKKTTAVNVGGVIVGGGNTVKIQSMTTTKTADIESTLSQISRLQQAGCEIVRVAVSDEADALAIKTLKDRISLPIVADFLFSPDIAGVYTHLVCAVFD